MNRLAFVAILSLLGCGVQPDLDDHKPKVEQVQPAPFHSQHGLYFKAVDDGSTYLRQLFDRVPIDRPAGITAEVEHWRTEDGPSITSYYLTARTPAVIDAYLASDPALAVPRDRELAFEHVELDRWRTYLLLPTAELDAKAIAHADAGRDPGSDQPIVQLDFTPAATRQFGDLTARLIGHKLAVLVDGTVISAPVINGRIGGGHASVTLGPSGTDAAARTLAESLDPDVR